MITSTISLVAALVEDVVSSLEVEVSDVAPPQAQSEHASTATTRKTARIRFILLILLPFALANVTTK